MKNKFLKSWIIAIGLTLSFTPFTAMSQDGGSTVSGVEILDNGTPIGRARKFDFIGDVAVNNRTATITDMTCSNNGDCGNIILDTTTCLDTDPLSPGADRMFHDTDCDGTKDEVEEYIDQPGLDDAECGNGQVYKKSAGTWQCGTDADSGQGLNIDRVLWVTTGGADVPGTLNASCVGAGDPHACCTGVGAGTCEDCSTEECCTLSNPCETIQQAINEATELALPTNYTNNTVISVAAGTYDEKEISFWNKDSGSPAYLRPARGVSIVGDGRSTTGISPTLSSGECVFRGTGGFGVYIRDLWFRVFSAGGSYGWCSDGGNDGF